jgi:DNA-binding response OmpR family regulator
MSGQRILVVDDDTDIRALLRELLERRGFSVAEAADGRQALQELYGGRPDLVLLDVGMPGMDGWTTLERIRELSDVPVVMLTARSAELEKTRGLRAGADDYVTKPFGRQELLARIEGLPRHRGGRVVLGCVRHDRLRAAAGHGAGPAGRAHTARVQAPHGVRPEPEPGVVERAAPRPCVG